MPKARYWGVRLDTAAVSPTAVRERRTEYTGMMSWYNPIVSAPTRRDRTMR